MEQAQDTPVIVKGLRKSFGEQRVLKGIDLRVARGEIVTVLGRSGTGKSVLLKLMIGLETPDAGSISIQGQEIHDLTLDQLNEVRKKIGFLFQQAALYDSMTVEQNVMFPLVRHSDGSDQDQEGRARELLSAVGLDSDFDKMPSEISGGMKKRVGLARALALNPEILMFDEPTAGLDPISAAEIAQLILHLKEERKLTSIVVTHDLHTAKTISDRFVVLHEGNVLMDGLFEDLEKSKDAFVTQFMRDAT